MTSDNQLFPVFLQLNRLRTLLVGGGNVALEKLTALLTNSPEAIVVVVAKTITPELRVFVRDYPAVRLEERAYAVSDLDGIDVVFVATEDAEVNEAIRRDCRERHLLINVADKPELCDFYLGSVVKKGNLKIGISTNGKSPTIAKRLREVLNEALPEELDETLTYMSRLRDILKGDFAEKVRALNQHTASLLTTKNMHE